MTDDEWRRFVERAQDRPPPMRLWGWWWNTPESERPPPMSTVIDIHGPRWPMVENNEAKEAFLRRQEILSARSFARAMVAGYPDQADGSVPAVEQK